MGFLSKIVKGIKKIAKPVLGLGAAAIGGPLAGAAVDLGLGLLGRKDEKTAQAQSVAAHHARFTDLVDDAQKAGLNPLTALMGGGAPSATYSAPPLASASLIAGAMKDAAYEFSGQASEDRARSKLETDLAKVKLEQAQAELKAGNLQRSSLGNQARYNAKGQNPVGRFGGTWMAPDREVEVAPVQNTSGVMVIDNRLTGGPVTVWGDEVASDISEMAFQGIQAMPQIGFNWAKRGITALGEKLDAANKRPPSTWDDAAHRRAYPNDY